MESKKLLYISSLKGPNDRGGAWLRNNAIKQIYKKLNFTVEEKFMGDASAKYSFKSLTLAFKFGINLLRTFLKKRNAPNSNGFDIVHLDNLRQFYTDQKHKCLIIYNAHNLEFENYLGKTPKGYFSKNFKKYEFECMRKSDLIFVCSTREFDIVNSYSKSIGNKTFVVPNLIDFKEYQHDEEKVYFSFIGALNYFPNNEALDFLCEEIFSKIKLPKGFNYLVAGKDPSNDLVIKLKKLGVKVVINPSQQDIQLFYAQTHTLLVPLSYGSGTRLKIIEAIAAGARILSTPIGAEGIPGNLIERHELHDFAENIIPSNFSIIQEDQELKKIQSQFDLHNWLDGEKFKKLSQFFITK